MKLRWIKWAAASLGLFVAAGVIAYGVTSMTGVADAQTPDDSKPFARYEEVLAQKLGVSVETLRAAQKAARDELIDEAVANGRLTPEQGEKLKSLEPGAGVFGLRKGAGKVVGAVVHNVLDAVAGILGIEREDVIEGLRDGKSLADLAEEEGVGRSTLESDLLDALQADIDEAEADGRLTAEQADRLSQSLSERIDDIIDRSGEFKGGFRLPRLLPDRN
jgi:lambda repressor-like predicted transcriptional regulator